VNQLVATLVVVLLPGILAAVICDRITVHSKWGSFKFGLYSVVLGIGSYAALQSIYYSIDLFDRLFFNTQSWTVLHVWSSALSSTPSIPPFEVLFSALISVPLAFFASYVINYKWINKLASYLKISQKYGDENLFSYYLNSDEIVWVYIRDITSNLTYEGTIVSFSENEQLQEVVLADVTVYRYEDSSMLYSVPTIYLAKPTGQFTIEAVPADVLGAVNDG